MALFPFVPIPRAESLRSSLIECVTANDPSHVDDLENGGDYPEPGPFVSNKVGLVNRCMAAKGWLNVPTSAGP
jgi:hypothetical protein